MQRWQIGLIKVVVWVACLAPLVWLYLRVRHGFGGYLANPSSEILHSVGKTGLNLLMITLAITPVRLVTKFNLLARFRRLLGLFSFFYLSLHLAAFISLDLRFRWGIFFEEIALRPYLTIGMLAVLLLIPLAVTSTRGWQRRLGRRWVSLHRLVYPVAILGIWHFWWHGKQTSDEPMIYAGILVVLLGYRLWRSWQRRLARSRLSTP
jgi:methionine sulfoxide reductase heme-binding subunit